MADGIRIAANTGFLWKDLPFLERIGRARDAGFDAVEFHDEAQRHDLDDVRAALREAKLPLLGLNTRMDETVGCAGIPGMEDAAREDIGVAIETARALGGTAVHVLAGKVEDSEAAWSAYRSNLDHAAKRAAAAKSEVAPTGLNVLIEPLSVSAMPGYLLGSVAKAASVIEWVGAPNLKIMFDLFHAHANGDPIVDTFERYAPHIGHVQLADPVSRGEPALDGPFAVGALVTGLREQGYAGAFGAEYVPTGAVEQGLGWMAQIRSELDRP